MSGDKTCNECEYFTPELNLDDHYLGWCNATTSLMYTASDSHSCRAFKRLEEHKIDILKNETKHCGSCKNYKPDNDSDKSFGVCQCRPILCGCYEDACERYSSIDILKTASASTKSPYKRPSKDLYYLYIAQVVSERSTCLRRRYGAVIVNGDRIVSTGYNGSARGEENCCDRGICPREEAGVKHGERYELCKAVHAEMNAIIQAGQDACKGSTLYLAGFEASGEPIKGICCCDMCKRAIRNAGIRSVVYLDEGSEVRYEP